VAVASAGSGDVSSSSALWQASPSSPQRDPSSSTSRRRGESPEGATSVSQSSSSRVTLARLPLTGANAAKLISISNNMNAHLTTLLVSFARFNLDAVAHGSASSLRPSSRRGTRNENAFAEICNDRKSRYGTFWASRRVPIGVIEAKVTAATATRLSSSGERPRPPPHVTTPVSSPSVLTW